MCPCPTAEITAREKERERWLPKELGLIERELPIFVGKIIFASLLCLGRSYATTLGRIAIDVLVEFEPGHVPGLRFFALERELSQIVGWRVDLNTPNFLSPYFRGRVLSEAEVQYVA
jgi:hypothetical protein